VYPSEKYEFVNGKDDIPYIMENIKVMFQTTNQTIILQPLIPLAGSSHESLAWLATGVVTHLPIGSMVLVHMLTIGVY